MFVCVCLGWGCSLIFFKVPVPYANIPSHSRTMEPAPVFGKVSQLILIKSFMEDGSMTLQGWMKNPLERCLSVLNVLTNSKRSCPSISSLG